MAPRTLQELKARPELVKLLKQHFMETLREQLQQHKLRADTAEAKNEVLTEEIRLVQLKSESRLLANKNTVKRQQLFGLKYQLPTDSQLEKTHRRFHNSRLGR